MVMGGIALTFCWNKEDLLRMSARTGMIGDEKPISQVVRGSKGANDRKVVRER